MIKSTQSPRRIRTLDLSIPNVITLFFPGHAKPVMPGIPRIAFFSSDKRGRRPLSSAAVFSSFRIPWEICARHLFLWNMFNFVFIQKNLDNLGSGELKFLDKLDTFLKRKISLKYRKMLFLGPDCELVPRKFLI